MTDLCRLLAFVIVLAGFTAPAFGELPRITPDCEQVNSPPISNTPHACFAEPYYVVMRAPSAAEGWAAPGGLVDVLAVFNSEEKGQWVRVVGCAALMVTVETYHCKVDDKTMLSIGIVLSEPQRQFLIELEKRTDLIQLSLSLVGADFGSISLEEKISRLCDCAQVCKAQPAIQMSTEGQITGLNAHCSCHKECLGVGEISGGAAPAPQKAPVYKGPKRTKLRMNGRSYKLEGGKLVPDSGAN